jgi:hypothetical protein
MSKVAKKVQKENELGARRAVLEDLFYDFNASRAQIYKLNFVRGIFFGVGTVIGGTLVVALVVWLLSWLTDIPGGFGDFIQYVVNTVQKSK